MNYSTIEPELLEFVTPVPDSFHLKCPICLCLLLPDAPRQSLCCGNHFCGSCIDKLPTVERESDEEDELEEEDEEEESVYCPFCKHRKFQSWPDKSHHRVLKSLSIYCVNKSSGCTWKGELEDLMRHLSSEEGNCKYANCANNCGEQILRTKLLVHEKLKCPKLPARTKANESWEVKILEAVVDQVETVMDQMGTVSSQVEQLVTKVQKLEEACQLKGPDTSSSSSQCDGSMCDINKLCTQPIPPIHVSIWTPPPPPPHVNYIHNYYTVYLPPT